MQDPPATIVPAQLHNDVARQRPNTGTLTCGTYDASEVRKHALPGRFVRPSLGSTIRPRRPPTGRHSTTRISSALQECTKMIVSTVGAFRQCPNIKTQQLRHRVLWSATCGRRCEGILVIGKARNKLAHLQHAVNMRTY